MREQSRLESRYGASCASRGGVRRMHAGRSRGGGGRSASRLGRRGSGPRGGRGDRAVVVLASVASNNYRTSPFSPCRLDCFRSTCNRYRCLSVCQWTEAVSSPSSRSNPVRVRPLRASPARHPPRPPECQLRLAQPQHRRDSRVRLLDCPHPPPPVPSAWARARRPARSQSPARVRARARHFARRGVIASLSARFPRAPQPTNALSDLGALPPPAVDFLPLTQAT